MAKSNAKKNPKTSKGPKVAAKKPTKKPTKMTAEKSSKKSPKTSSSSKLKTVSLPGADTGPYVAALPEPRRTEIAALDALIRKTCPKLRPGMYGASMLGYGPYHYKYASGHEGDAFQIALSSRANYISLYCLGGDERGLVAERYKDRLPKADIGKACVRFKRLSDLDLAVVAELLRESARLGPPGEM